MGRGQAREQLHPMNIGWALVLKGLAAPFVVALYYFVVIKGLRWLYPRLPRNAFVDFLFRERSNRRPDYGPP